jgi:hypothetical protein
MYGLVMNGSQSVDMIGHHDKIFYANGGKIIGYLWKNIFDHPAGIIQCYSILVVTTKKTAFMMSTNSDEIVSGLAIIVPR